MVKRALTLLTSILIALPLLMPFNIFADETVNTAPFLGVNVQFTEVETEYTSMTMPILNFGYAGTQNTTGSVTGKLACSAFNGGECKSWSLQNSNGNSVAGLSFTMNLANLKITENGVWQFNKAYNYIVDYEFVLDGDYKGYVVLNDETTIYVNGRSFHHSIRQTGINENTFTITDYDLTLVSNPILWNLPMESFNAVINAIDNGLKITDYYTTNYFQYPIFQIKQNDILYKGYFTQNLQYIFIFYMNAVNINSSSISNYLDITNFDVIEFTSTDNFRMGNRYNSRLYKITLKAKQSGNSQILFKSNSVNEQFYIPIYFKRDNYKFLSTDFALLYGLSNELLDNLDIITNGTTASQSAVQSSDSTNSKLQTESNTLFQQENGFKSDMQSAMQNVDTNFRLENMGTKFVSSAQWVRTQYENLTNNTPFASLITFSLITGLALILLGKVYR